jgi:hypothetical protein
MRKVQLRGEAKIDVEVLTERGIWIGHVLSQPRSEPMERWLHLELSVPEFFAGERGAREIADWNRAA